MGVNCCKENDFDKVVPCKLSGNYLVVVTTANELKHIEVSKGWTEYSVDIDHMSTDEV